MKYKFIALSILLAGACASVNAQEANQYYTKKWSDNIYVGAGVGAMAVFNNGMNTPTANFNISVGKHITPTWGVRAQFSGLWQSLDNQANNYHEYCKKFGELNFDAMLNVTNLIGGYNPDRAIDFYAFAGPTMNVSKVAESIAIDGQTGLWSDNGKTITKARFGATFGLGLGYNVNEKWSINLEARTGVTPSVFGNWSACRKAEATGRLTIGATYTFGGKKFVKGGENKIIEKEVIKEVTREVPVEVVKEVVKEIPGPASAAIFFKIGKAVISPEGMVNVKLMAKVMKENPNVKYTVAGFADKGTGSADANMKLSEKRAQAVYDALVSLGISPERLEKKAMGGTDPMFEKAHLNRVVILETK